MQLYEHVNHVPINLSRHLYYRKFYLHTIKLFSGFINVKAFFLQSRVSKKSI